MNISSWVKTEFNNLKLKLFLELGSHAGEDTAWLAEIPNVTVHTFEPDPRNQGPNLFNVIAHRYAISDSIGTAPFLLSDKWEDKPEPWTYSSSLCKPKTHLTRWPITFGETILVETITLDQFYSDWLKGTVIDFIWCDIQGAEGAMIRGGLTALSHTRYLYTEYSDQEEFEGQASLREMLELLPSWKIVFRWPDDVLLENTTFPSPLLLHCDQPCMG